ncbi:TrbI/VirB10 family protein [Candidatus Enterovibrio escicola]|uniref:Plasmid conjugative transfer pilus assembly protein TraB n=1 Tax=Candidatus Enterovibrio escicola TaxID=1927127 RepID=A0A2A5T7A6_9GAMM|nr:TrbI/VirB10 family protein [Candidatus Enterovibrio escacola]PCS24012.1 plasmid conjugative transfer pilus assembly protein TraB [Candidatus Enterovibrio escacola]
MEAPSKIKRRQMMIAGGGFSAFIILMMSGMWLSDPNRGKPTPLQIQAEKAQELMKDFTAKSSGSVTAEETWIALSEKQLKELQTENKILRDRLDDLARNFEQGNSLQAPPVNLPPAPTSIVPQTPVVSKSPETGEITQIFVNNSLPPPPPPQNSGNFNSNGQVTGQPISTIQVISLSDEPGNTSEGVKSKNVSHYLPTGSFATAVLLSGMDAPTGGQSKSQPIPVLLRVIDAGQLPNYWNSDIDNCHVTGAAHGDISSERAHIRLENMTCILVNGDVIEESIRGYVAGEDGKAGLRGRLVSKQGSLIAKSLLAGVASGIGSSISQQYQQVSTSALGNVTTIDPNKALESGLARGTSNSLEKITDFYIARANETYPIIEVDANRIGEIILLGGTDFGKDLIGNTRKHRE